MDSGYVLVQIKLASICGSDYMVLQKTHPYKKYPAILGHEFVGEVINNGHIENINIGDKVTALSYGFCGKCEACLNPKSKSLPRKITYNTAGNRWSFF
ncbi:alcohol dehydrogenase catalytic domain-containing protein [Vibrio sp. PP-XX7]